MDKPLWEFQFIQNIEWNDPRLDIDKETLSSKVYPKPCCVVRMKVHHSLTDGVSLLHHTLTYFMTGHDKDAPSDQLPQKKKTQKGVLASLKNAFNIGLLQKIFLDLSNPKWRSRTVEMTKKIVHGLYVAPWVLVKTMLWPKEAPIQAAHLEGVKRVALPVSISLEEITHVRVAAQKLHGLKPTVNDVLASCISGAVVRYSKLMNKGDQTSMARKLLNSLEVMLPNARLIAQSPVISRSFFLNASPASQKSDGKSMDELRELRLNLLKEAERQPSVYHSVENSDETAKDETAKDETVLDETAKDETAAKDATPLSTPKLTPRMQTDPPSTPLSGALSSLSHLASPASNCASQISISVPVNLRKPLEPFSFSNELSAVIVRLPTAPNADPSDRLEVVTSAFAVTKGSPDTLIMAVASKMLCEILPFSAAKLFIDMFANKASLVFSSLPGPAELPHLGPKKAVDMFYTAPQRANIGACVTALSHSSMVRLAAVSDRGCLSDPDLLLSCMVEEFREIQTCLSEESPNSFITAGQEESQPIPSVDAK
eukprot:Platyproteum_vivax@DN5892_c0_g1_i1.p1